MYLKFTRPASANQPGVSVYELMNFIYEMLKKFHKKYVQGNTQSKSVMFEH